MRRVVGLIEFRFAVPAYMESAMIYPGTSARVRTCRFEIFRGREIHLQAFPGVLAEFYQPAAYARRVTASEIAIGIFQMFVAQQNLRPLAVILFQHSRARHEDWGRASIFLVRFSARRGTIDDQKLHSAIQREIATRQNFGLLPQGGLRHLPRLVHFVRSFDRSRILRRRLLLLSSLASCQGKRHHPRKRSRSHAQIEFSHCRSAHSTGNVNTKLFCHSERSEESLLLFRRINRREIPRSARNDKIRASIPKRYRLGNASVISTTRPVSRAHKISITCGTSDPAQSN